MKRRGAIEPGATGSYARMADRLKELQPKLKPLPDLVHTMAGDFRVVTDQELVEEYLLLDKDDPIYGLVLYNLGVIVIDTQNRRLRAQWEILIHEVRHIEEKTLKQSVTEEEVQQSSAFQTDFLERNGMLDRRDGD